jgi:hypothetical protein
MNVKAGILIAQTGLPINHGMLPRTIRSVILIYCHTKLMLIMNLWLYVVHGTMVRTYDTNSVKIFVLSVWFSLWNSTSGYKACGELTFILFTASLTVTSNSFIVTCPSLFTKSGVLFVPRCPFMYICNFFFAFFAAEFWKWTNNGDILWVYLSASPTKLLDEGWCSLVLKFSQKTHTNLINLRVKKDSFDA